MRRSVHRIPTIIDHERAVLVSLASYVSKRITSMTKTDIALVACAGLLALAVLIEFFTLVTRVLSAAQGSENDIPSYLVQASIAQTRFHDSLSAVSPALLLFLLFSWVPVSPFLLRRQIFAKSSTHPLQKRTRFESVSSFSLLALAITVGTFVTISPYFTHRSLLGIDTLNYYRQLESLKTFDDIVLLSRTDPHPLFVLLLYLIRSSTGWSSFEVIVAGPAFLAAFFAVASFLLALELTQSYMVSGIASVFAVSWLHTTVGLFAGIFPNWLAMSFAVLSLSCLFKMLRDQSKLSVFATISFTYMTALSHIWTWAVLVGANWLGSVLLLSNDLQESETSVDRNVVRRVVIVLVSITLPVVVLSLILPELSGNLFSPGVTVYGIAGTMRFERISQAWFLISFTLTQYVGGLLGYPLPLALGLGGMVFLAKSDLRTSPFLIGWLIVTSISTLMLDSWYQWRVLYVIPFEIFAAMASVGILRTLDRISNANRSTTCEQALLTKTLKALFVITIILDSASYAIAAVATLPQ